MIPPCGSRDSRKAVAMNKRHPYRDMEREYITSDISIRELCRRHGISAHSLVTVQARQNGWQEKREAYQARASESFIAHHADRMAERQAVLYDLILDTIEEALTKFREDMRATKKVRQPDGSVREEPAFRMMPRDLCHIIDRFEVLFARPSSISQHQGLTITSQVPADDLVRFIEATRGISGPLPMASPMPRAPRRLDD